MSNMHPTVSFLLSRCGEINGRCCEDGYERVLIVFAMKGCAMKGWFVMIGLF